MLRCMSPVLAHTSHSVRKRILQKFMDSIAKAGFNRIEPVVEKVYRSFGFRLRLVRRRAMACHGVISAGICRNRLLHQAGDYAAFNFQPLPLRHRYRMNTGPNMELSFWAVHDPQQTLSNSRISRTKGGALNPIGSISSHCFAGGDGACA
jgi:hypothetical protein